MIVSRKCQGYNNWRNLEGVASRLSGPYDTTRGFKSYYVNLKSHRLYGRSFLKDWDINDKLFKKFKEV